MYIPVVEKMKGSDQSMLVSCFTCIIAQAIIFYNILLSFCKLNADTAPCMQLRTT